MEIVAGYSNSLANVAINEILEKAEKRSSYVIRSIVENIYFSYLDDEIIYIDKTPRYYLVLEKLINTFPDSKFIFLYRNPLDVVYSVKRSWSNNSYRRMFRYKKDYIDSVGLIVEGREYAKNRDINCFDLTYEKFVTNPQDSLEELAIFLGVENNFSNIPAELVGRFGDKWGKNRNSKPRPSVSNWEEMAKNSSFDKYFLMYVLKEIGEYNIKYLGYHHTKEKLVNIKAKFGVVSSLVAVSRYFCDYLYIKSKGAWKGWKIGSTCH